MYLERIAIAIEKLCQIAFFLPDGKFFAQPFDGKLVCAIFESEGVETTFSISRIGVKNALN